MKFTTSDGAEYIMDEYGIHQVNAKPFVYDTSYCAIYDDPERQKKSDQLQALRLGFIVGAHEEMPNTILDVGSGNFAFLNYVKSQIELCFAYDVADYPVPLEIMKTDGMFKRIYDVVTFFDCLEHIQDLSFLEKLDCDTLVVSAPDVQMVKRATLGEQGFMEWFAKEYPHRKPNEHLHHWDVWGLRDYLKPMGWNLVAHSNLEDKIRDRGTKRNIFTAAFKRNNGLGLHHRTR